MADSSPRFGILYVVDGQQEWEAAHDEMINAVDALVSATVLDRDLTAPPSSPANGDAYLVAAGATGDWAGKDGQVAYWVDGWVFYPPVTGLRVYVADDDVELRYAAGSWGVIAGAGSIDDLLDVDTTTAAPNVGDVLEWDGAAWLPAAPASGGSGATAVNAQTGTSYTLQASDDQDVVTLTNAGAITVTLPADLPAGFTVALYQLGAGQVTFTAASGATLQNRQGHAKTAGQYAGVGLVVTANSDGSSAVYVLTGDTAA